MEILIGKSKKPRYKGSPCSDVGIMLSIVIVNYMSRDYLRSCLDSIFSGDMEGVEIIVVDNGSKDRSVEMVRENFPSVNVIEQETNVGFARANNIAIKMAKGRYILILNPDTELKTDTLKRLVDFMENEPTVSAAGCKVLYPDGRNQLSCGYLPTVASAIWGGQAINRIFRKFFPGRNFFGACALDPEALDSSHEVETLLGACVILRKNILETIGLFDEGMFVYFEECDLFYRIRNAGGKIMYTPDATIYHHAGGSSSMALQKSVTYYLTSQEYYLKKNLSLRRVFPFRASVMVSAFVKSALLATTYPLSSGKDQRHMKYKILWHWYTFLHLLKNLFSQSGRPEIKTS